MQLAKLDCKYGAPMGRGQILPVDSLAVDWKCNAQRVTLDTGGYDRGGAYWGIGAPLFWIFDRETGGARLSYFLRAHNRDLAISQMKRHLPNLRFK